MSAIELNSFPDEILLKIFSNLDSLTLFKFGHVSKRFRYVSRDKILWQKAVFFHHNMSPEFLKFVLYDQGCEHLSLQWIKLPKDLNLAQETKLKILDLSGCDSYLQNFKNLLLNCKSLQKLSLPRLSCDNYTYDLPLSIIEEGVCQNNGKTLQVLDMGIQIWFSKLRSEAMESIVRYVSMYSSGQLR